MIFTLDLVYQLHLLLHALLANLECVLINLLDWTIILIGVGINEELTISSLNLWRGNGRDAGRTG